MQVAILVPLRFSGSAGFLKHLAEVVPRWLQSGKLSRISIVAPEGTHGELEKLGVEVCRVGRYDYKTGFSEMGTLVKAGGYDVALCTITRPVKLDGCPIVTMIHSIEPIQNPEYSMPLIWRMRLWMLRRENAKAIRHSARVLAVSNYSKEQVCRRFGIQPEMVGVVYHGFDPAECATLSKPGFDIPGDFIFSAGSIVPYRGFEDIIRSLAEMRSNAEKAPCAILAGSGCSHPTSYERSLKRLTKSLGVEDLIIWAGQLHRDEMAWCFQNAKLFIQTSRAEACPNIVLEAMGHGCVAISCDHPPMPEFFGDTALYYPTGDAGGLTEKIQRVLEMDQDEIRLRQEEARLRASFFTWEKTADQTLEVLAGTIKYHKT